MPYCTPVDEQEPSRDVANAPLPHHQAQLHETSQAQTVANKNPLPETNTGSPEAPEAPSIDGGHAQPAKLDSRARVACKFFASGTCRDGANCSFSHQEAYRVQSVNVGHAEASGPDWRAQVTCKFFAKGSCRDGQDCPYSHAQEKGMEKEIEKDVSSSHYLLTFVV